MPQSELGQLAAKAAHLARQSNDQGLARVANLARLAADRLDDAVNTLATTPGAK